MKFLLSFILSAALFTTSALALSTEKKEAGFPMDGVTISSGSSGAWRSVQATAIVVEPDDQNDVVLKMPSSALLAFTSVALTNPVRKAVIDVKLPSSEGEVKLFSYNNVAKATAPQGTPVILKNGGAYVVENDTQIPFVTEGTMNPNKWYKVARIFDFRIIEKNMQRAIIYDDQGQLVGMSNWTQCGQLKGGASAYHFPTLYFETAGFSGISTVLLDDLEFYSITVENVGVTPTFNEDNNSIFLTFTEPMKASSIHGQSIILSVDNADYTEEIISNVTYDQNQATITYNKLPFSENITVKVLSSVTTADEWSLGAEKVLTHKTKDDPFFCEDLSLNHGASETNVSATIKNQDAKARQCLLVMFLREQNNNISNLKAVSATLASGEQRNIGETIIKGSQGQIAEVYLWDNWHDMTPIRKIK